MTTIRTPRRVHRPRGAGLIILITLALSRPGHAPACDVCAVYTATEMAERRPGLRLGVAQQVTSFGPLQESGHAVPNPANEHMTSAITQVVVGYNLTPRLGLQLNLPIVSRTFQRLEQGRPHDGDETGVGDLSLLAHVLAASTVTERSVFRFSLLAGLKLPSGDSGRLREELHESADAEASGIHGHDLTLGSGSVDGLVGGQLFWSWQRLFVTAAGQYALRTTGAFGYRFADELTWSSGPGVFVVLGHDYTLAAQAVVSGETKGKDSLDGAPSGDTGVTSLYAGPGFGVTWRTSLAADVAVDLPVVQHNTALQLLPDLRVRGGVTWRF
jgi:hypothetical protein